MKLTVGANAFNRAMKICASVIDPKDSIRSNVELRTEGDVLCMRASNAVYVVELGIEAKTQEEGLAVVDGRTLFAVAQKAKGDVVITSDGDSCVVKSNGRTRLSCMRTDVPEIADLEDDCVSVNAEAFKGLYGKVSYAIGEDQSRITLTGVNIECANGEMRMVALDGFQLATSTIPCEGEGSFIVPGKLMDTVCMAMQDSEMTIATNGRQIVFRGLGGIVSGSLLTGEYIDYKRIVPTEFKTVVLVDTEDVRSAIITSQIATEGNNLLKIDIGDDKITIRSNNQSADFEAVEDADIQGDGLSIAFNVRYLVQSFNTIQSDKAEIKLNSPVSPAVITEQGSDDIHLVLPVRVFA